MLFLFFLLFRRIFRGDIRTFRVFKDRFASSIHDQHYLQIECFSDPQQLCLDYGPTVIECDNTNPQTSPDFNWQCKPVNWSLRHHIIESNIVCEGWDDDFDQFVVEGSCRIQLRMIYDRVQVQIDRSLLGIAIPGAFVCLGVLVIITGCIWFNTYGMKRIKS
jgi:hypothetical protein